MITKFSIYETRFSDQMRFSTFIADPGLYTTLKDYSEKEFEIDREFKKFFTIGKKLRFHVIWNQNITHNIYEKIKDRKLSVKSITEFNDKIKQVLERIPHLIENQEIYASGKYGLILTESNFCIIIKIDIKKYFNKDYEIEIKTVMPMTELNDVIREIKLNL